MSSQPSEIADRALQLASTFLADATDEIVAMADGDFDALYDAAQIIRSHATGSALEHSGEHLAFSLVTAAHNRLRSSEAPDRKP